MEISEIKCDGCDIDLSKTGNSIDYRLGLYNERLPCGIGAVTDMMIYPIIERNAHFCGLLCLRAWLDKIYPNKQSEVINALSGGSLGYACAPKTAGVIPTQNTEKK